MMRGCATTHNQLFYSKLPKHIASKHVILVDPMLGTGGSSSKAIEVRGYGGSHAHPLCSCC
jgi:uracil phosphoribosyltransferase